MCSFQCCSSPTLTSTHTPYTPCKCHSFHSVWRSQRQSKCSQSSCKWRTQCPRAALEVCAAQSSPPKLHSTPTPWISWQHYSPSAGANCDQQWTWWFPRSPQFYPPSSAQLLGWAYFSPLSEGWMILWILAQSWRCHWTHCQHPKTCHPSMHLSMRPLTSLNKSNTHMIGVQVVKSSPFQPPLENVPSSYHFPLFLGFLLLWQACSAVPFISARSFALTNLPTTADTRSSCSLPHCSLLPLTSKCMSMTMNMFAGTQDLIDCCKNPIAWEIPSIALLFLFSPKIPFRKQSWG